MGWGQIFKKSRGWVEVGDKEDGDVYLSRAAFYYKHKHMREQRCRWTFLIGKLHRAA